MQEILIVGGHINYNKTEEGNVINVPCNKFAELNMFLDPFAAKTVLSSEHNITLIPLGMQRKVSAFPQILEKLYLKSTPEAVFARRLMSRLYRLQKLHPAYRHVVYNSHLNFSLCIPAICLVLFVTDTSLQYLSAQCS